MHCWYGRFNTGVFLVKGGDSTDSKALSHALHRGTNVAMGLTIVGTVGVSFWLFDSAEGNPIGLAISVIGGLIVGWALGKTAEFYTSDHFAPVRKSLRNLKQDQQQPF